MPGSMAEFSRWTDFRNWSMTGTVIRWRSIEEAELFLYGFPVSESKRRNQTSGEGGCDVDDDCCRLEDILNCQCERDEDERCGRILGEEGIE